MTSHASDRPDLDKEGEEPMCCNSPDPTNAPSTNAECGCGCGGPGQARRRFLSPEEQAERLAAYREQLLREAAEVEKRIAALAK